MTETKTPPGADAEGNEPAQVELFPADQLPPGVQLDPAVAQRSMVDRVLQATNIDELFGATSGDTSDARVGREFQIDSVEWGAYEGNNGVVPLARVKSTDLRTGEVESWVTTALMLTSFIRRAEMIGALPFKARIVGKKTRSGQQALNFERI